MPEIISSDLLIDFLAFISKNPQAKEREIAKSLQIRKSTAHNLFLLCEQHGLIIERDERYELAPKVKKFVEGVIFKEICINCMGRGFKVPLEKFEKYVKILRQRPWPKRRFDQYQATEESVCARVMYLITDHAVKGKEVLLLGDDDWVSVGLSFYGKPKKVVVLEIDEDTINSITKIKKEYKLPIEIENWDLNKKLPSKFQARFDTVFGDAPYTREGISQWLRRAIEALKKEGKGYLAVPFHQNVPKQKEYLTAIHKILYEERYMITEMIHGFHFYEGNDYQRSSMLRFEKQYTQKEKELVSEVYWWDKPLGEKRNIPDFKDIKAIESLIAVLSDC